MVLIIGITGATRAIYGIRLLQVLSALKNIETHLIISEVAQQDLTRLTILPYDINPKSV